MQIEIRNGGAPVILDADLSADALLSVSNLYDELCSRVTGDETDEESVELFKPLLIRVFGKDGAETATAACKNAAGVAVLWSRLAFESRIRRVDVVSEAIARYSDGIA